VAAMWPGAHVLVEGQTDLAVVLVNSAKVK
jgi:hypothetical protein